MNSVHYFFSHNSYFVLLMVLFFLRVTGETIVFLSIQHFTNLTSIYHISIACIVPSYEMCCNSIIIESGSNWLNIKISAQGNSL